MSKIIFPWPARNTGRMRLLDNLPAVNQIFQQPPGYYGDVMFRKVREASQFGEMSKTVSSVRVNSTIECRKLYDNFVRDIHEFTEDGRVFTIYFSDEGMCQTSILWFPQTSYGTGHTFYVI